MAGPIEQIQTLPRELFQFDSADLDFGIYRIMDYERDLMEKVVYVPETFKALEPELKARMFTEVQA